MKFKQTKDMFVKDPCKFSFKNYSSKNYSKKQKVTQPNELGN